MMNTFDLTVSEIKKKLDKYVLIDVRESYELMGPEGYIEGVLLSPLSQGFEAFLNSADGEKTYIFICRSGYRSAQACALALSKGLQAYNMAGGMIAWREMERG
jgi:rhodanese-related sulfurtransferase